MWQYRLRPLGVRLLPLLSSDAPRCSHFVPLFSVSESLRGHFPCRRRLSTKAVRLLSSGMSPPQSRSFSDATDSEMIFSVETDDEFTEKVINSSVPVLVDFYANWCGPCKMLGPRIEAKVAGRNGQVALAKVNVDYAGDLAMEYEVQAVPTVIAFKEGEQVGRFEGDHGDDHLEQFIEDLVRS